MDNVKLVTNSYHTLANGPRSGAQNSGTVFHLSRGVQLRCGSLCPSPPWVLLLLIPRHLPGPWPTVVTPFLHFTATEMAQAL